MILCVHATLAKKKKKRQSTHREHERLASWRKESDLIWSISHFAAAIKISLLDRSCGGWRSNPRAPGKTAPALAASHCLSGWETGFCVGSSCSPPPPPPPPNRSTSVQPHKSGRNAAASSQRSHKRRQAGLKGWGWWSERQVFSLHRFLVCGVAAFSRVGGDKPKASGRGNGT